MFKVDANPTFPLALTLTGQGRSQKFEAVARHRTREQYLALIKSIQEQKADVADVTIELLESWNADLELTKENVMRLHDQQPGSDWAIIGAYGAALQVERQGN